MYKIIYIIENGCKIGGITKKIWKLAHSLYEI